MTEKGQYPLVYQLEERNGVLVPVGLAEASSLGSFSAVNIVVSSISATDYLGFEGNVSFTGVISVQTTGAGTQLVYLGDPNNPVIRSLATPTTNFLEPSLAGDGTVNIGYGASPLSHDHGGTNNTASPVADGVAHWYNNGGNIYLDTEVDFTFNKTNLSIPSAGKYQIGGNNLKLADIDGIASPATLNTIPAPATANTYLIYNGTGISWSAVTGVGGGGASFPNVAGRIPITDTTTNLNTYADLAYDSGTKVVSTYAINNVCDVCAIRFNEGGTLLTEKYQGKDDTLTTIASLNPGANQLIYFTNTNVAATASVSPCGLELLNDATYADMRTTLQLNTYYQATGIYLTAIPSEYLTVTEADALYQTCDVLLQTISDQGYIDLETADVDGVLPVIKGGTSKNTFNVNQLIYGEFSQDANLTYTTNTLKSPTVCATMVCATTFTEGGTTLASKYLTQANAATTYQPCDVFLTTLATNDAIRLDLDVTNTLGVTRGGTGLNTISNNQIVVGNGTNTIGTITTPTDGTYLKYNTAGGFSWSLIPTGTGTTLPSEPCAVVFMDATGAALAANKGIKINTTASTLMINSDADVGSGGLDLYPGSAEGFVRWDPIYHTLGLVGTADAKINLGVDEIIPIINESGAEIKKGQICYVSGVDGGSYRGRIALLSDAVQDPFVLGVLLATTPNTNEGYLIKHGLIRNANPADCITGTTPVAGNVLYVSPTPGKLTVDSPAAGSHAAKVGLVLSYAGNISFGVTIEKGLDLAELHDVNATPTNTGDTLVWNTGGYYTTGTINQITGTLNVSKGGTGSTSFSDKGIVYYDGLSVTPQLISNSNFIFESNVLKSPAVCATTVCATTFNEGGTSLVSKYLTQANATATYQPTSTRLHELTGVTADGLLRFNGSNYVSQPTATYETTAYSRNTYETTGYARSTYETTSYSRNTFETTGYSRNTFETTGYSRNTFATTASLAIYETTAYSRPNFATTASLANYETTGYSRSTFATTASLANYETTGYARSNYETTSYARNVYETTGYSRNTFETTGYSRNTFATTASLVNYETTGYSRTNFATTASLANYETTGYARSTYETTGYSRNTFVTTGTLTNYTLTSTFNTFSQGVTDNRGVVFANGTNLDTTNTLTFDGATNVLRATTVSSDSTYFLVNSTSKSLNGTLAWYDIPTNFGDANAYAGGLVYVTGTDKSQINSNLTFDEANNRLKVTTVSATTYNNLALSSQLSDVQITATITNGYALKWNSSLSKWTPQQDQTGGGGTTPGGNEGAIQFNREGAFYGDETNLMFVTGTNVLKTPTVSATTVSAGTIHVGGSDGYIRNNNGSIGISSIGGSVSISGTGSVSLQGLQVNAAAWPEAGSNNGVVFYSDAGNSLLIARLNGQALNGSRDYFGSQPQGYLVASYLGSSTPAMQIDPYYATNFGPTLPNNPQNKEVLVYNTNLYNLNVSAWTWEGLSLAGGYLSDVNTANVNTNDTLVYNGTTWTPKPSNGISSLLGNNLISS